MSTPQDLLAGLEIGGTKLQLVLGDSAGRILHRWRAAVDRTTGGEGVRAQIEQALRTLLGRQSIAAIGVGFGGPVDWKTGRIALSHQVRGWENFDIRQWLENLVHVPAIVDNDANVAALGETLSGAGRGASPVFYMNMGSGVGGGLIVDGRIFHGATPGECEFGHIRLDRSGTTVESRCSGWAIDARIREIRRTAPEGILAQLTRDCSGGGGGEARFLAEALRRNDPPAQSILSDLADDLAFAFSHVIHLLHPEKVILGGGLSLLGQPLRDSVAARIGRYIMAAFAPGPDVALAALGEDTVPVGALHLADSGISAGSRQ